MKKFDRTDLLGACLVVAAFALPFLAVHLQHQAIRNEYSHLIEQDEVAWTEWKKNPHPIEGGLVIKAKVGSSCFETCTYTCFFAWKEATRSVVECGNAESDKCLCVQEWDPKIGIFKKEEL